jgi:hypothetical protein
VALFRQQKGRPVVSLHAPAVLILAEDDEAREVYAELFAMRGYAVVTAASPRDGVRLARMRRDLEVAVLLVKRGLTQLRRRLIAVRPHLRVHVPGLPAAYCDRMAARALRQIH